ncbi:MAG: PRC-barrel domain-containing protein [Candidatus Nanoarchaeia archaeon]|nr:PRC-barrel domain-containing protein [Candidatus Nanoarchaeia archaeon]MDD5239834.1 PRC-barrel domain-containing protein [Candidatus Nanoarchaeia archaeon]
MVTKGERVPSKNILGRTVVSKAGKKFGEVGDMKFESKTGELIYVILKNPTPYAMGFDLEKDEKGNIKIPFASVVAVGDYVVVAEEDIL